MRQLLFTIVAGGVMAMSGSALAQTAPPDFPRGYSYPTGFASGSASSLPTAAQVQPAGNAVPSAGSLQAQLEAQRREIDSLSKTVRSLADQLQPSLPAAVQPAPTSSAAALTATGQPAIQPVAATGAVAPGQEQLRQAEDTLAELNRQQAAASQTPPAEKLQKQLELQQKQIEVLNKMVKLLAARLETQTGVGPLDVRVATLEARSRQAAQRDQELAAGLDNLIEHTDAAQRNWPLFPAPLKEMFDTSYNNETPLSIYGALADSYTQFHPERWGVVATPTFSTFFLLTLNDRIFVEANVDLSAKGADVPWAQLDFLINDHLTAVLGRYLVPIGFYNERLAFEWGNKMSDDPLMFHQVSPLASTNGLQLRGSSYVCGSPVKVEYSVYAGNGMELAAPPAALGDLVNLDVLAGSDETHAKAVGGRLGVWLPPCGINGGISGYFDYNYALSAPTLNLGILSVDASYHMGNWDARFEAAFMDQQAAAIIGQDIRRYGLYAQLAYRPYDVSNRFLQKLELVGRFSLERFVGIDAAMLDFTTFSDPTFVPVDRNQYAFSINYYFYASGIIKFGYEINQELHGINLDDNAFFSQVVLAF